MVSHNTHQYLTFTLDEESFAIEIMKVREALDYQPPIRVPRSPDFLVGVINLRGKVIPVIKRASSDDKKRTAFAISSGIMNCRIGMIERKVSRSRRPDLIAFSTRGVHTTPGALALTLIPLFAHPRATTLVK